MNEIEYKNTTHVMEVENTLNKAKNKAMQRGAKEIDLVHVLLALLESPTIVNSMNVKGIDCFKLKSYLEKNLDDRGVQPGFSEMAAEDHQYRTSRILFNLVTELRKDKVITELKDIDLLNAIWNTPPSPSREYYAVTAIDLCLSEDEETIRSCSRPNFVFEVLPATTYTQEIPYNYKIETPSNDRKFKSIEFCNNLTQLAYQGKIDPVFGREKEINNMMQIVTLRRKNNPILLGEPGVGKTAVVEGLASKIINGDVPEELLNSEIVALDIARFIAGTRQRGDFEQRITNLVETLEVNKNIILFIDEIHTLVGGTVGASDAAELLKPALSGGKIKIIGATTHGEYLKYFGKNPAMARRFQPITIAEPNVEEAIKIIDKVIPSYEKHHKLTYCKAASKLAVELSKSFIVDKQLPDKAIDVIDRAGSLAKTSGQNIVTEDIIYSVIQTMSGIQISSNEKFVETVAENLQLEILGQEEACKKIAKTLARANSGFSKEDRAKASILLYGPDSVGKRHVAKQIAKVLNSKMIRLDMSEFAEKHTTSRLVGSPPGYVGYGEGGQLSEAVRRNPSCVIFLDRIDLAHPNVTSIINQAIENGILTDSMGNLITFTGVTVIMSMLYENNKKTIGFSSQNDTDNNSESELPQDLLDVVDVAIELKTMPTNALTSIAEKYIIEFVDRLKKKEVIVNLPEDTASILADIATSEKSNAKAIEKAFKRQVEDPILDSLPQRGQNASLTFENKEPLVELS